jgi:ankyrin repeat protein
LDDFVGNTPLSYAVRSEDNVDAVRYLLDHDADPDKPVDQGIHCLVFLMCHVIMSLLYEAHEYATTVYIYMFLLFAILFPYFTKM